MISPNFSQLSLRPRRLRFKRYYARFRAIMVNCHSLSWLWLCIMKYLILSWVSNGVIGFPYPVTLKENPRGGPGLAWPCCQHSCPDGVVFITPNQYTGGCGFKPTQGKFSFRHLSYKSMLIIWGQGFSYTVHTHAHIYIFGITFKLYSLP